MTATYSDQELNAIVNGAMLIGMAVAMADMGIISTAIEAAALSKEILGAAAKFPNNSVIQAAFSDTALRNGSVFVTNAIAAVNSVVTSLESKATAAEIQEYKSFVYGVAETVAKAAGSGLFGSGDPKITDKEATALAKIKTAMNV